MSIDNDSDPFEIFEIDGISYKKYPTLEEFIMEAGFLRASQINRFMKAFDNAGIRDIAPLLYLTEMELFNMEGISPQTASVFYTHAKRIKLGGHAIWNAEECKKREDKYRYLPTGSMQLDAALQYPSGQFGWRSNTLVELVGPSGIGKSQVLYTAAAMVMAETSRGGWDRDVIFIDTTNSFSVYRMELIAKVYDIDISQHFHLIKAFNFDEVELALEEAWKSPTDIGLIIIDDLITPLKTQYPTNGQNICNLRPKQEHLIRIMRRLRDFSFANNSLVMYANHLRRNIDSRMFADEEIPTGGHILSYNTTIRLILARAPQSEVGYIDRRRLKDLGLKATRAKIQNCGFLPDTCGYFLVGPAGITHSSEEGLLFMEKALSSIQPENYFETMYGKTNGKLKRLQ